VPVAAQQGARHTAAVHWETLVAGCGWTAARPRTETCIKARQNHTTPAFMCHCARAYAQPTRVVVAITVRPVPVTSMNFLTRTDLQDRTMSKPSRRPPQCPQNWRTCSNSSKDGAPRRAILPLPQPPL
jgi:hypothetical protein